MCCRYLFHLYLHLAIAGIHIVELLDAGGTGVLFFLGIELLVDMEELPVTTEEEPEVIKAGILIIVLASLHGIGVEQGSLDEDQTAEIKVVADTAELVVDNRMLSAFSFDEVIVVGVGHCSIRI